MTDSERELYRRTVDDCRVVADGMASDDVLKLSLEAVAELLGSRLRLAVTAGAAPSSRVTRGHLRAVPTPEAS